MFSVHLTYICLCVYIFNVNKGFMNEAIKRCTVFTKHHYIKVKLNCVDVECTNYNVFFFANR